MPRPSQKEDILAAALACFAELGYEGTRIRHIAQRAGVSEGALYRHFPSKEAVAQTLFTQYLQMYVRQMQQIAAGTETAVVKLQAILEMSLASYRQNPAAFNFILLQAHTYMPQIPPDAVFPIDVVTAIIREGQQIGLFRSGHPTLLAAVAFGCLTRPIIVAQAGSHNTPDLQHDDAHDSLIITSALTALQATPGQSL